MILSEVCIRLVPSGLFIVTLASSNEETGMLASWVQQCSFDPPQLTIALRSGRPVLDALVPGASLGVNVVPEGGKALIAHFGKGFAPGEPAFEGVAVECTVDLSLHVRIVRSAAAFRRDPVNVLTRVLDVAGFTVNTILCIYLQTFT